MKKLKLIYNPASGDKTFPNSLDACVHEFQQGGYETHIFRSMDHGDIESHVSGMDADYDLMVVSGGDGTLNLAVNGMMKSGLRIPLAIIPSGTANDFATFLKMPRDYQNAAKTIVKGRIVPCDLGLVNGRYFINVCAAGLLTNISQQVDSNFKDSLGKLAYYIKGIEQLPNFVPMPVRITTSSQIMEEDVYLFLTLNSAGTGGFENLSPEASLHDGLFDFIAIRAQTIRELAMLFLKILKGEFLEDSGIIFLRDKYVKVESISQDESPIFRETDIDGELGPDMPAEIQNIQGALNIMAPITYGGYDGF